MTLEYGNGGNTCWERRYEKEIREIWMHAYIGRFYTRGRVMRLDELGQTFVIRVVIRL